MYTPARFGLDNNGYTFPVGITQFSKNFANVVPGGRQIPGRDGGYDFYGGGIAPTERGNISLSFVVKTSGPDESQWIIDDTYGQLVNIGRAPLFFDLDGVAQNQRFCYARLNNNSVPIRARNTPYKRLRLQMQFRVDHPVMLGRPDIFSWTNDGHDTGDGIESAAARVEETAVSNGSTVSVTNNGTYPALCLIRWDMTDTTTNPKVSRKVDGLVYESVQFTGTYEADAVLIANGHDKKVFPSDEYANLTVGNHRWLTIPPGTSTLDISGTFSSTAKLTLDYWDTWK